MGGFEGQPRKVGGGTQVAAAEHGAVPAAGSPGKATLVDGAEPEGWTDVAAPSRDDPKVRPPEYAAMDADCVRLLDEGRATFKDFAGKPDPFWDLVDKHLNAGQLQSFTQTIVGARAAGLLPQITGLVDIYNHGSSWGIHFKGAAKAPGGWGKDYDPTSPFDPQKRVRAEHGNTKHVWYRQPSGAGNAGMHIGTQEEGEGETNLHWDPSNPMDHVSQGTDGKNNPLLSMMPNPFQDSAPVEDALIPKGCAVYNLKALITHADDIGWIDKNAPFLKRFVPAHTANGGKNSSTEPFHSITQMAKRAGWGKKFATWELDRKAEMVDQRRGVDRSNALMSASTALEAHEVTSRSLAVQERTPATEPGRIALANKLATLLDDFYNATTAFFQHLHAEMGESPSNWGRDDLIKMGDNYWSLQGTVFDIHKRRADKKKASP